jgi:ribonuclease HI
VTRRRREPDVAELIRFIADHESLQLTCDEYPRLSEERIRALLRKLVDELAPQSATRSDQGDAVASTGHESARRVVVFSDGAARGNPGPAGAGWVIRDLDRGLIEEGNAFLGRKTNNEAEYEAVIHSLQAARALGAVDVALRSDSELLVRQINGQYRVRNERLTRLHRAAREVIQAFRRFEVRHVPREENVDADAQANRAIDEAKR